MGSFSKEGLVYISAKIDEEMRGSKVDRNDVLLNITGASIGRVCLVPDEVCPANVNQHVCIIRCDESLYPGYVEAVLSTPSFQSLIWQDQAGATRQALTKEMVENFQIPWKPIEQQRRIADGLQAELSEVATARKAAQGQLRDVALLRKRVMRQAFDALHDAPRKVLGDWAKTTSGSTPSRADKRYWSRADIPWVKTGEVAFAPILMTEESISRQALKECSLTLLPPKTVLVAMYGQGKTRGQSAVLEVEATTNQACFAILPNGTWDTDFLYHWLMASYEDLRGLSDGRGGNQANLNGALLNALAIPAPDLDEQTRIVKRLKSQLAEVGCTHQAVVAQLAEIEGLPQRILAQAVNTQGDAP
ncbi:hypothetical protein B0E48_06360 [Rhodanobacter sp. C03]|nr:hypothetical protein B0E48_06360 [Rhodanobacter sp. C03]